VVPEGVYLSRDGWLKVTLFRKASSSLTLISDMHNTVFWPFHRTAAV
jgi:hypothetical protein